jgi:hypothetical protein
MLNRRSFILQSASTISLALYSRVFAASPSKDPPDAKGKFLMTAMRQAEIKSVSPPPSIVPFGDWDFYYLKDGEAVWRPNAGQSYKPVVVPIGFVTDLASIPAILWFKYPAQGRYAIAAIIHDYLYWDQRRSRSEADDIFRTAMADTKVDAVTRDAFWTAVRLSAESAWKDNSRKKAAGEKRFLKKFPPDLLVSWSDWKKRPDVFAD